MKKGVLFLAAEKGINGTVTILLIPVMIQHIGVENYGLWGILLGIVAYILCLDFGIVYSMDRFVAYYSARKDVKALSEFISTAMTLLLIISLVVAIPMVVWGGAAISYLTKGSVSVEGRTIILLLYPAIMANWAVAIFSGVVRGLQRFDISSKIQISTKLLFAATLVILLTRNKTVVTVLYAYNVQCFAQMVCYGYFARRLLRDVPFMRLSFSRYMAKKMIAFGFKIQISAFSTHINQQFDKFLLLSFSNLTIVGYYDAASRIVTAVKDIPLLLFSVLVPKVSTLAGGDNRDEIQGLFYKATSILAIAGFTIIGMLVLNSEFLIGFILKKEANEFSIMVFNVLCITMVWQSMSAGAAYVARGMGMTHIEMKTAIIVLVVNVVASYTLISIFGYRGVVFGTALSSIIAPVACYKMVCNEFRCEFLAFMYRLFLVPLSTFLIAGVLCWLLKLNLLTLTTWWLNILITVIVFGGLSHLFYRLCRYQPYEDLLTLIETFRKRVFSH